MSQRSLILMVLVLAAGLLGTHFGYRRWRDHRYDDLIRAAAQRYGVQPALIKAVIWRESRFDPNARGTKEELGLMQIRGLAALEWTQAEKLGNFDPLQLLDARTNMLAGTWYLAKLLKRYAATDNPIPYALADYNAGRRNVLRWNQGPAATNASAFLNQIDFPGTRQYLLAVMDRYQLYQPDFPEVGPRTGPAP